MNSQSDKKGEESVLGITIAKIASPFPPNLVEKFWMQSLARELLPGEKVASCLRELSPLRTHVAIARSVTTGKAHYRNLVVCSRIWQCPICASTITEYRRKELSAALETSGLFPVLVTYTLQHKKGDSLSVMVDGILEAYRALKSGKAWKEFTEEFFWVGSIRSLEVTYGVNGWHPHIHELALLERENTAASENGLISFLKTHWIAALKRQGKTADWSKGADISTKRGRIADYVAKYGHEPIATRWTEIHELTKAPAKKGRMEGRTPMQLLADYGQGDVPAGALFIEYSYVFKGRNQLVWSRGLRERLGLGLERADDDIAEDIEGKYDILAELTREQWGKVLRSNKRGELLQAANEGDLESLYRFISEIVGEDESHG